MANQGLLWSLLFDQISDGICISSPSNPVLYMNPAAKRLMGLAEENIGDASLCQLLCAKLKTSGCDDCASACPLRELIPTQKAVTFTGSYPSDSNGHAKPLGLRVRCMKMPSALMNSDEPDKNLVIIEDVSAQLELDREKEDWRHMVAHDLRTPLSSVFATFRLMQEIPVGKGVGPDENKQLQIGVNACKKMIDLLDLYLDIAKLEAGLMPVQASPVNLGPIVQEAVEMALPFADSRGVKLQTTVQTGAMVQGDPDLVKRVLDNLINNAIKFTPVGGSVLITAEFGVRGNAKLSVKDTGPGISGQDLPNVFDRLYQSQARRQGRTKGAGLGLAFCQRATQRMGGSIEVLSQPGRGSEFIVTLPSKY